MGEQQFRPDRSDALGQAWRGMSKPRGGGERDLPTLPDWPPLLDEPSQADWPTLAHPVVAPVPDESHPADALQPTVRDGTLLPAPPTAALPPERGGRLRRLRRASPRARLAVVAGVAIVLVLLIVACSSLALRISNGLRAGAAVGSAAATQIADRGGASSKLPTVTPRPTPTATPKPTPTRPPTAAPAPALTLAFTCASGSLRGTGQVCVHTEPGATLSISVRYCDGTTAKGLHGGVTADGSGNYTWSWQVRTTCAGSATATVTANWNGQAVTQEDTFTITK